MLQSPSVMSLHGDPKNGGGIGKRNSSKDSTLGRNGPNRAGSGSDPDQYADEIGNITG